jgi:hypothetical protein
MKTNMFLSEKVQIKRIFLLNKGENIKNLLCKI